MLSSRAIVTANGWTVSSRAISGEGAGLTSVTARTSPLSTPSIDDGARALPLAVTVWLLLDVITTLIGQAYGVRDLGPSGPLPTVQMLLITAAAATAMYGRPRAAVLLSALVAVLVFLFAPSGMEPWLLIIVAVVAAARAGRVQLALVVLGEIAYAVGFGFRTEHRFPGSGLDAGVQAVALAALAIGVGLVARWLLHARDRRRARVRQLVQEQTEIREIERARLADELQVVVTCGLATIEEELEATAHRPSDVDALHRALARIDLHSRALLTDLRILLDALRQDFSPDTPGGSPVTAAQSRSWVDLLTARHVRIAATAVCALLALRAASGAQSLADADVWVEVLGLLAAAVAIWRPVVGAGCAVAALSISVGLHAPGQRDVLSTTLLCLLGALKAGPRRLWLVLLFVAGYCGLLAVSDSGDLRSHVVTVCNLGFLAMAIGLTARHFVTARRESLRQLGELTDERDRVHSEERSAVARELHDVVAHSLSVTAMLIMATSMSDDRCQLIDTLDKVRRSTETARQDLSTLVFAMRGPQPEPSPGTRLTPLASANALGRQLADQGFHPVFDIDPAADRLDPTTQRTVSRIMQEASTNILRYTPPGSACSFTLDVAPQSAEQAGPTGDGETGSLTSVRLVIASPASASKVSSDLSLGWGLRGIRERVELMSGTFTAGPDHGRWVLKVTLPASTESVRHLPLPAAAGLRGSAQPGGESATSGVA
jgi:signal transduction histidine kinase